MVLGVAASKSEAVLTKDFCVSCEEYRQCIMPCDRNAVSIHVPVISSDLQLQHLNVQVMYIG